MNETLKTTAKSALSTGKVIMEVMAMIGVLWGAFKFIDQGNKNTTDTKEIKQSLVELKEDFRTLRDTNAVQHSRIMGSIGETQSQISEVKENNAKWNKSYLQYVKDNTKSSEQLYKYIEGLNLENVKKK